METKKDSTSKEEFNLAEVKPEFKKHNGENVRIMDMSDNELLEAIDFMAMFIARKERELSKLLKVQKYLHLECELRGGNHIVTPCKKGDNQYKLTDGEIINY